MIAGNFSSARKKARRVRASCLTRHLVRYAQRCDSYAMENAAHVGGSDRPKQNALAEMVRSGCSPSDVEITHDMLRAGVLAADFEEFEYGWSDCNALVIRVFRAMVTAAQCPPSSK